MSDTNQTDNNEEEIDAVLEDELVYDDAETPQDTLKRLRDKLKKCQSERQEYLDGWQRSQADIANIKKRAVDEQGTSRDRITIGILEDILPVLDSFDMAFKDKEAWESAPEQWRKGIEYIHSQMVSFLHTHNVSIIDPLGKPFDHNEHHSVATIACEDDAQDGIVLELVRKGYKFKEMIFRPADVKVGSKEQ